MISTSQLFATRSTTNVCAAHIVGSSGIATSTSTEIVQNEALVERQPHANAHQLVPLMALARACTCAHSLAEKRARNGAFAGRLLRRRFGARRRRRLLRKRRHARLGRHFGCARRRLVARHLARLAAAAARRRHQLVARPALVRVTALQRAAQRAAQRER